MPSSLNHNTRPDPEVPIQVVCIFLAVFPLWKGSLLQQSYLMPSAVTRQLPLAHSPILLAWLQSAFVFISPHLPSCWCRCQLRFLISITTSSLFPDSLTAEPTGCFDVLETKTMSHGRTQGKCIISRCLSKTHFRPWQPLQRHRSQGCDMP